MVRLVPRLSRRSWLALLLGNLFLAWYGFSVGDPSFFALQLLVVGFGLMAVGAQYGVGISQRQVEVLVSKVGVTAGPELAMRLERQRLKNAQADFDFGRSMVILGIIYVVVSLLLGFGLY